MKKWLHVVLVLAAVALSVPHAAHAADIAFFPVEGATVRPEDASAIGELLAQSYALVSGQAVLAPSRVGVTPPNYGEAAKELGVAEYVRTDAVALGQRIVVHSVRHRADGSVIYQTKMTAERIEDMTTVSDRMARVLFDRKEPEGTRTQNNVTLSEGRPKTRRWVEQVVGFKTGVHLPFAKGAKIPPSLSSMFDLRIEAERFFLEFGVGLLIPSAEYEDTDCWADSARPCRATGRTELGGVDTELGGNYFLTKGTIAPYVGGGVMPRLNLWSDENDWAHLAVFGQVGVTLPRDSSTRFYVDVRVAQNVLAVELDNNKSVLPTELSFHAGVGW